MWCFVLVWFVFVFCVCCFVLFRVAVVLFCVAL